MKKIILLLGVSALFLTSCVAPIAKSVAYKKMYDEKPVTILLMPPINKSTNVEAKEYFHSTLNVPIDNAGYYVIPPFISMEILKKESAYDAELFLNSNINKFGEVFGADLTLFTIIHKWDKSVLFANVTVEIEYIFKSTKTNEVVYTRRGTIVYSTAANGGGGGLAGAIANVAITALKTATTQYVKVARVANNYTFQDLPAGKYSTVYGTLEERQANSGSKVFRVNLK